MEIDTLNTLPSHSRMLNHQAGERYERDEGEPSFAWAGVLNLESDEADTYLANNPQTGAGEVHLSSRTGWSLGVATLAAESTKLHGPFLPLSP